MLLCRNSHLKFPFKLTILLYKVSLRDVPAFQTNKVACENAVLHESSFCTTAAVLADSRLRETSGKDADSATIESKSGHYRKTIVTNKALSIIPIETTIRRLTYLTKMDALLLEFRLSIEAVQGYVSVQEKSTVKIHKNKLETSKDNVTCNFAFKHFTVQPSSCKGLRYVPNEGLHFRMALGEEKLTKQHPKLSSVEDVDSQLLNDNVSFYCATCGHCITKAQK